MEADALRIAEFIGRGQEVGSSGTVSTRCTYYQGFGFICFPEDYAKYQDLNMANTRQLVSRRKAIRNIRKITRTMELIATARFKKALDRATEAEAYTRKIAELAADLSAAAANITHPLLAEARAGQERACCW